MKKVWKIIGIIAGVVLLLFGGLLAWLAWEGSPREIVAVADEFKPDPSWQLTDERITPPRHDCIDVQCPNVDRRWRTAKPITLGVVQERLKASSWDEMKIEGDCTLDPKGSSEQTLCSVYSERGDYIITLYMSGKLTDVRHNSVILGVSKK